MSISMGSPNNPINKKIMADAKKEIKKNGRNFRYKLFHISPNVRYYLKKYNVSKKEIDEYKKALNKAKECMMIGATYECFVSANFSNTLALIDDYIEYLQHHDILPDDTMSNYNKIFRWFPDERIKTIYKNRHKKNYVLQELKRYYKYMDEIIDNRYMHGSNIYTDKSYEYLRLADAIFSEIEYKYDMDEYIKFNKIIGNKVQM